MDRIKIFDAEMNLMVKIWDEGSIRAIDLANWATEHLGWKKNSTYSMLKKLLEKKAVARSEPGFVITPLVSRDQVAREETEQLVERMFKGNMDLFLASLIGQDTLSSQEIEHLRRLIDQTDESGQ